MKESIAQADKIYRLMHTEDRLRAIYPESAHDFPPDARQQAYQFIDFVLRPAR